MMMMTMMAMVMTMIDDDHDDASPSGICPSCQPGWCSPLFLITPRLTSHLSHILVIVIIIFIIIFSGHLLSNHHHLIIHHIRLSCPSYLFVALMLLKGRYPVPAPDEPNIRPPGSLQQLTPYMSIVLHTPTPYMSILHTPGAPSIKIPCSAICIF